MPIYNEALSEYITQHFAREDLPLREAREKSPEKGLPAISIQPEEGRFLQVLVASCRATKAVEIGTLGGYSGIWIARGLVPGGKLYTLEKSEKHKWVAQEHFAGAGVADRVEIILGDAHQSLKKLAPWGPFDFVFIDADKSSYNAYYDWAITNVRVGGIITAHNMFRNGNVLNPDADEDVATIDALNRRTAYDPRVISTIFPAGDGTLVAVRIG
ncbi:MAG: class I SAM-dependent methyltransferase [Anaerolineales bacterium]